MSIFLKTYENFRERLPSSRGIWIAGPPAVRRGVKKAYRKSREILGKIFPLVLVLAAGYVLGNSIITQSPAKVIAAVLAPILLAVFAARVDIGIIAVMFLAAGFIYGEAIPKPFTVGGQGFAVAELLILFLLVVVFLKVASDKRTEVFRSPITIPLLLFLAAVPISIFVAYSASLTDPRLTFDFREAYNESRPIFYYLLFFIVAFGIRDEKRLNFLLRALIWLSAIVAVLMVVQYFLGTGGRSVFIGGKWHSGVTRGLEGDSEIARSIPPGIRPIMMFFPFILARTAQSGIRRGFKEAIIAALFGVAIVFTFTRGFWLATAVSILTVFIMVDFQIKKRLLLASIAIVFVTVIFSMGLGGLAPGTAGGKFAHALTQRFESMFEHKSFKGSSWQNRVRENKAAIRLIKDHPVFGVGVSTPIVYKFYSKGPRTTAIQPSRSIHNSYLELWALYGILGLVSFFWISGVYLVRCYLLFRRARNNIWRILAAAFFARYIGYLLTNVTGLAILHEPSSIATVTVMWGIIEIIWWLNEKDEVKADDPPATISESAFRTNSMPRVPSP